MFNQRYPSATNTGQVRFDPAGAQQRESGQGTAHSIMSSSDGFPASGLMTDFRMNDLTPEDENSYPATNAGWSMNAVFDSPAEPFYANHAADRAGASQSEIVKTRADRVNEHYGNLTPPDDNLMHTLGKDGASEGGAAPILDQNQRAMDRSERARNAAIQRHAKSKRRAQKETRGSESDSEDSSVETDGKRERYREKNRAAAAKCRAKKKTHVERIESDARSLETENAMLKARVRELRNQHAELRDLALQHNPSVASCQCGSLHQYNMSKAAEITSTFNAFANLQPDSLSDEHGMPGDLASADMLNLDSRERLMSNAGMLHMDMMMDAHSFSGNYAFAGVNTPQNMQQRCALEADEASSKPSGSIRSSGRTGGHRG